MTKKQKKMLVRILITAVMLIALKFIPIAGVPQLLAYVAAYLVIGYDILRKAGKGILNGRAFDENFLMTLATLGAFFLAIWTKSGDYVEGIAVMLFYQIGELFQSSAVGIADPVAADFLPFGPPRGGVEETERTRMGVHRDSHRIGKMTLHGIAQNDTASAAVFRRIYDGKRNSAEKLPANRNVA